MPDPVALANLGCKNFNNLREPRIGVMLHYDESTNDTGAMAWFKDPECKVSYDFLVLDDGRYVQLIPDEKRAWHAGACKTSNPAKLNYSDANSAFLGISVATNSKTPSTQKQYDTVVWLIKRYFAKKGWPLTDTWRIVGHDTEAIFPNNGETPVHLRGKRGRKIDPTGPDKNKPILSVARVREAVAKP